MPPREINYYYLLISFLKQPHTRTHTHTLIKKTVKLLARENPEGINQPSTFFFFILLKRVCNFYIIIIIKLIIFLYKAPRPTTS